MGEHVDTDEGGLDRISSDDGSYDPIADFGDESLIRANILWRGADAPNQRARRDATVTPLPERLADIGRAPDNLPPLERVLIGSSSWAKALRDTINAYANNSAPVLIVGETGVGKELVARELHRRSARRAKPFVALNTGAIPATLAASELFGHRKGAFTGAHADQIGAIAAADGGVLFLDEIGDTPLEVQSQLLRVLDDGMVTKIGSRSPTPVDFRLIAATNVDLRRGVATGAFRRDLFHRLDVLVVEVPPLRDRVEDIVEIGEALIRALPEAELKEATLSPKAADRLKGYRFPGNVRELRNVLTRAAVRARGGRILPEHITFSECEHGASDRSIGLDISRGQELVSRFMALKALLMTDGNVTQAAKMTGRGRSTIHELKRQLNGGGIAGEFDAVCAQMRALIDGC